MKKENLKVFQRLRDGENSQNLGTCLPARVSAPLVAEAGKVRVQGAFRPSLCSAHAFSQSRRSFCLSSQAVTLTGPDGGETSFLPARLCGSKTFKVVYFWLFLTRLSDTEHRVKPTSSRGSCAEGMIPTSQGSQLTVWLQNYRRSPGLEDKWMPAD